MFPLIHWSTLLDVTVFGNQPISALQSDRQEACVCHRRIKQDYDSHLPKALTIPVCIIVFVNKPILDVQANF